MFNHAEIRVELAHKRREMLQQVEQHRIIREVKKATPHPAKSLPFLNAILTAFHPC